MLRITDILDKTQSYLNPEELEMIKKAYVYSATVHQGQVRLSGEPYLTHPMEVAGILADMKMDAATIISGLLHDTVEDTLSTVEQIENEFGKDVAFLVSGLTKLSLISFRSQEERQAENFRKMILAMSSDIRILLVRLADRIHNMRTLQYQPPEKRIYIARETIDVYAPLANRLGINWMRTELEDLAFQYLLPDAYNELSVRVAKSKEARHRYTEEVKKMISSELQKYNIKGEVEGRAKHLYGIYKKMHEQHIDFDEVYDLIAFRVILDDEKEKGCYETLSVVHSLWKPVPGRFKDYIAMPKANNYQSLHTTVIGPYGERVEIQIRTKAMHEWAEKGIAAHWRYKEGRAYKDEEENQIKKLREILEIQQEIKNPKEFMSDLRLALFPEEVYVFTPHGDVKSFPKGATPIDFAYSIHTDIGNQCIGAKVNRNIVPLKYKLQNGDRVEIITQAGHHPSKDWLKYVVTTRAISKIRNWINAEEKRNSIALGRDLLEKEFKKQNLKLGNYVKSDEIRKVFSEYSVNSLDDLLSQVGFGRISARQIVNHFLDKEALIDVEKNKEWERKKTIAPPSLGVSLTGIDNVMVKFAKCCNPIPGDEIAGYVSRGRGITVHTRSCPHLKKLDKERIVDVQWNLSQKNAYPVHVKVVCDDSKGVLTEVSSVISSFDVNISYAEVETINMIATCNFVIDVNDLHQLNQVVAAIRQLKFVKSVMRLRQ
ncbi:MAG TPA: bifunctional (p)ppGpp synthetase/guanosine-3',5'-bis(diphosphate) 3'-pyrophosphohydrolase [Smithellaceae bacterium]|nr:MAG: GTP pyrophosphokinase [Deltaproteobacteria bacterium ADurb.BinA014]HNQ18896.1 bifunctional (p)ppGpp synthetase/guanosine-3',5'-bis(diphosphate) 3'-pyrophosphohydrolase [Smithellaceae bacterium]HPM70420.1 bifunctional (p)ppGpp synthetase/guanosine-3',5'-bis(diphosphate) 3'-pyrophosphohydrolase [Smithellaceae bacterium]HQB93156.1 bifunctional (p)ppGpp synthetase/guanosine-3',5'-bis(diphosphate) 3'-pyrophosphohydrolase [Smithellaceae bacterium]